MEQINPTIMKKAIMVVEKREFMGFGLSGNAAEPAWIT
jgi:hypothetical protein